MNPALKTHLLIWQVSPSKAVTVTESKFGHPDFENLTGGVAAVWSRLVSEIYGTSVLIAAVPFRSSLEILVKVSLMSLFFIKRLMPGCVDQVSESVYQRTGD